MRQVDATLWRPRDLSSLEGKLATAATSGGTPLVVSWKHKPRGVITLYDSVKDDAANAVADLEKMGVETVMLSRDTYPVARRFADNLGISKVLAGIALGKKEIAVRAFTPVARMWRWWVKPPCWTACASPMWGSSWATRIAGVRRGGRGGAARRRLIHSRAFRPGAPGHGGC